MKNISAFVSAVAGCLVGSNISIAADLVAAPNWTGPYIGITAGIANSSVEALPPYDPSLIAPFGGNTQSGSVVSEGLVVGYDRQFGSAVLGVLAEINHTNISTSGAWLDENSPQPWGTKLDWLGSARARFGVTAQNVLFYGTGGIAFTDGKIVNWNYEGEGDNNYSFNSVGFVFGGGAEMRITPKWTAGVDFSHYVFKESNDTQTFSDEYTSTGQLGGRNRLSVDVFKFDVNYRF